jgi:hypothetical protein
MSAQPNFVWSLRTGLPVTASAQITERWQRLSTFRGHRIAVPDSIARYFDIDDIKIHNRSQFPSSQSMSAELFGTRLSEQALLVLRDGQIVIEEAAIAEFGRSFLMDTCQVAMEIVVSVSLKEGAPPTAFEMLILGVES